MVAHQLTSSDTETASQERPDLDGYLYWL
jgi:hypothetical protein